MMRVRSWFWVVMLAMGVVGGGGAIGQQPGTGDSVVPARSVAGVLRSLASRAGVVFVGQVQSIVPKAGVVEITFQVQQSVLGGVVGTYVLREWAGRWAGGQQRFRIGQRAMFFLHAPGAAGLSSPVDGMAGVVPLIPMGTKVGALLDVRWLATRVSRPVGSSMGSAGFGAIALADAEAVVTGWKMELEPEPVMLPLPVGVRPLPVMVLPGKSSLLEQTNAPSLLQPQEQLNVER
jgi:hypothetical protein